MLGGDEQEYLLPEAACELARMAQLATEVCCARRVRTVLNQRASILCAHTTASVRGSTCCWTQCWATRTIQQVKRNLSNVTPPVATLSLVLVHKARTPEPRIPIPFLHTNTPTHHTPLHTTHTLLLNTQTHPRTHAYARALCSPLAPAQGTSTGHQHRASQTKPQVIAQWTEATS